MTNFPFKGVLKLVSGEELFAEVLDIHPDGTHTLQDPMMMVTTNTGGFVMNRYVAGVKEQIININREAIVFCTEMSDAIAQYYELCTKLAVHLDKSLEDNIFTAIEAIENVMKTLESNTEEDHENIKNSIFNQFLSQLNEKDFTKQ
jgi:hypothetical protein